MHGDLMCAILSRLGGDGHNHQVFHPSGKVALLALQASFALFWIVSGMTGSVDCFALTNCHRPRLRFQCSANQFG